MANSAGQISHQGRRLRRKGRIKNLCARFLRRNRCLRRLRNPVGATCPRVVLAVCEQRFSFGQCDFLLGPINSVLQPIRHVGLLCSREFHDTSPGNVEIREVSCHYAISSDGLTKLFRPVNPAGNYGIRIHETRGLRRVSRWIFQRRCEWIFDLARRGFGKIQAALRTGPKLPSR